MSPSRSPLPYPPRIHLAHTPTPFDRLERLSREVGGPPIWVKRDDMTGLELTGNKARKLEFLIADAQAKGCDALLTYGGVQSNHCRATASVGARLGMPVRIIIRGEKPEGPPEGNLMLDYLFGAEVRFIPGDQFLPNKSRIIDENMAELRARGLKPYYFPVGGSVPVGLWAYVRCLEEIRDQAAKAGVKVRHVAAGCGSGGTTAGLALGRALLGWKDLTVWAIAVTQTEAFWKAEFDSMLSETNKQYNLGLAPEDFRYRITDKYVGKGYAISYPEEIDVIRQVARLEGIVLDPVYTGKAMTGVLDLIRRGEIGKDEPVVFVHTGGIFGLFPMRAEFA